MREKRERITKPMFVALGSECLQDRQPWSTQPIFKAVVRAGKRLERHERHERGEDVGSEEELGGQV